MVQHLPVPLTHGMRMGWAHYKKLEENGFRIFTSSYFEGEDKEAL